MSNTKKKTTGAKKTTNAKRAPTSVRSVSTKPAKVSRSGGAKVQKAAGERQLLPGSVAQSADSVLVEALPSRSRRRRLGRSRRAQAKPTRTKLLNVPGSFRLFGRACKTLWACRRPLVWLVLVYGLLDVAFVHQFVFANLKNVQSTVGVLFGGTAGTLGKSFSSLTYLMSNDATSSGSGTAQFLLVVIMSLSVIWLLRQHLAGGVRLRARDCFYRGMYPLVPFVLVLLVLILQLVPMLGGASLLTLAVINHITVNWFEAGLAGLGCFLLALWSLWMVCASLFALYVTTLPEMTPFKALRTARELVRFRRFALLRKILFAPLAILVIIAAIIMPLALAWPAVAPAVFLVLTLLSLPLLHSYLYTLYRALL